MKVMVFGAFDILHDGHGHFLNEAKALGDYLVVALASDSSIRFLKGHDPQQTYAERAAALSLNENVDEVLAGDELDDDGNDAFGTWQVIEKIKPDIIACGYDQQAIQELLSKRFTTLGSPQIITLPAYKPTIYKSSLLNSPL
jgi:FAD synthetase